MIKFTLGEQAVTPVPTIFLKKYMCDAPADYVKVYLYGLYLAGGTASVSDVQLEEELHMAAAQIEAALNYWCLKGLLSRSGAKYVFLTAENETETAPKRRSSPLYEEGLANFNSMLCTILNRELSPNELTKIYDYTDVFGLPREVVLTLVEYCAAERGQRVSVAYLDKVAEAWAEEGINTPAKAKQRIEDYKAMSSGANRLMRVMGQRGKYPGKTELDYYTKWTEEWGFTHEAIEFAMKDREFSASQPFKYLDAILSDLYERRITSSRKISEYYAAQKERREVLKEILTVLKYSRMTATPKQDQFYDAWTAAGFTRQQILMACAQSVRMDSRRFESVDAILKEWKAAGLATEEDIKKYLRKQNTLDRRIAQVYQCLGVERTVGETDRQTYLRLTQEKGLAHEVLMYAAEYSSLKDKPFEYMMKVLNCWADQGVDTLEKAQKQNLSPLFAKTNVVEQRETTAQDREQRRQDAYEDMEKLYGK